MRASLRTGLSSALVKDRIFMFGGVCDKEGDEEEDSDDEDEDSANFFNELYSIHFDGERATWSLINYTGKKEEKSKVEENVGADEVKQLEVMSIETSDSQPE